MTGNSTHKLILLALAFSGFIANSESLPNLFPFVTQRAFSRLTTSAINRLI